MKKMGFVLIGMSLLLAMSQAQAKGKPADGGGGAGNNMTMCLTFDYDANDFWGMQSDGGSSVGSDRYTYDYCDGRSDYTSLLAGDMGFNFETNTRKNNWSRWIDVDLGNGVTPYDDTVGSGNYSITFRFDKDDGGLDLKALEVGGDPGYVSVSMWFVDKSGDIWFALAHGTVPNPLTSGALDGNACVQNTDDLEVRRTSASEWVFSYSGTVCMWDKNVSLSSQPGAPFNWSYAFTVTSQP